MKTVRNCMKTGVSIALLALLHQSSLAPVQAGDTKPFKETNIEIFFQDVAPGSFLQPEFEAIRAVRGQEDTAAVYSLTSNSNVAGKGTRFALNINYVGFDGDGNLFVDAYSINNLLTADGSWLNAWGEMKVYYGGPKAGTFEGEWVFSGGTGRFEGATGGGTFTGTFGDDPIQYLAIGEISTVGSLKSTK